MSSPITVLDLAKHRGVKEKDDGAITALDMANVDLPMVGGCVVCQAVIAAYNACPSKSGYLKCSDGCIGDDGWDSVEEANKDIFGGYNSSEECHEDSQE